MSKSGKTFPLGPGVALAAPLLVAACATLKAPTMQVQALGLKEAGLTGAALEVSFRVRNPNPEPLRIERFEYELFLNGERLGRGYHPDALALAGFGEGQVVSSFDLNYLSLPATVQEILKKDRVRARVQGDFYVQGEAGRFDRLGFKSRAQVRLKR